RRGRLARRSLLHRRWRGGQDRRSHRPLQRRRPPVPHRRARQHRALDPLGEQPHQPGRIGPPVDPRPSLSHRPQRDDRRWRRARRQIGRHRSQPPMSVNPGIFKAYDVRGVYPSEINEDAARAIGAAFVAYLKAKRIAVGRDMRLSSPSLAAAFIDGATSQGADVVDYGMIPTDMLYFAVARDGHDGGVQITASHNPKQYNGMKMVRKEAFPLSGDEGINDIRDMIASDRIPAPAARPGRVTAND